MTPRNGISELLESLRQRVSEDARLCYNTPVQSIHRKADQTWQLTLGDGSVDKFDAVVLAMPAFRAADLLKGMDSNLAQLLNGIEYASTAIVVSGHQLADIEHPLNSFGLVIPAIERRHILAVSFTSRKFPGRAPEGCVELRTFVGGAMQPELLEHKDDHLIYIVQAELREIFGVKGKPDFVRIARWNRAMPQYHVGHLERIQEIENRLQQHPSLALAGNAYRGVGIPDCIHSGELAAESIIGIWNANIR